MASMAAANVATSDIVMTWNHDRPRGPLIPCVGTPVGMFSWVLNQSCAICCGGFPYVSDRSVVAPLFT